MFKFKLNNRGAVLITVYMVLFVLMALSSGVALFNFSELRDSLRHLNSVKAFWLAEEGLHTYLADLTLLEEKDVVVFQEGEGLIRLTKDDSDPRFRLITSTGTFAGSQRRIRIKYPALATIFETTMATKGDLVVEGRKSSLLINDKIRLGGTYINTSQFPLVMFEDKEENVREPLVSITYPDADGNGKTDEFNDFVVFNRGLIAQYAEEDVIYIKGNDTYTILPDESLKDKKIIYIEGDREGEGHAVIQFTGGLAEDQNLTVIVTGTVTQNQAGIALKGSQLNVIAWSDYYETSVLPSVHNGMIYTHGTAHFDEVHETSVTNGSVVANEGIVFGEVWSTKTFNYADMRKRGHVPPGFEGLLGGGVSGYTPKPNEWREVYL